MPPEPTDPGLDIRIRTLLSSWKLSRGFRAVGARHYRSIPHGSQTDLNREFENRRRLSAGTFFIALFALATIDYFYCGLRHRTEMEPFMSYLKVVARRGLRDDPKLSPFAFDPPRLGIRGVFNQVPS